MRNAKANEPLIFGLIVIIDHLLSLFYQNYLEFIGTHI